MKENKQTKQSNIYHRKIILYLGEKGSAKNISEIAGDDTNHTPYKIAMAELLEEEQVIKPSGVFMLPNSKFKGLIDNEPMREAFKNNKEELMQSLKTGKINKNMIKNSGLNKESVGKILNQIKGNTTIGEELREKIRICMAEARVIPELRRVYKKFVKKKNH